MRRSASETRIESVPRDCAVKAAWIADPLSTNMRLGLTLQRLYPTPPDEQPDRFGQLLMLLDRKLSQDRVG
jgi:hypothetical protein